MHHLDRPSTDLDTRRLAELDALATEISNADAETLNQMRRFLLNAMFPSMPDTARAIVGPLFALVTLEGVAIEQARSRLKDVPPSLLP